jgi:hypothetical protein
MLAEPTLDEPDGTRDEEMQSWSRKNIILLRGSLLQESRNRLK